jgi:hypothetical protein
VLFLKFLYILSTYTDLQKQIMGPPPSKIRSRHSIESLQTNEDEEDAAAEELERLEKRRENAHSAAAAEDEDEAENDEEASGEEEASSSKKKRVNLSTENESPSRKRLAELLDNPYPHKHRKPVQKADPELTPEQTITAYRHLDRSSRWLSFLYMTSNFHHNLICKVFEEFGELDIDGDLYTTARNKVKDSIRGFKSKTCAKFIVSVFRCCLLSFHVFCLIFKGDVIWSRESLFMSLLS